MALDGQRGMLGQGFSPSVCSVVETGAVALSTVVAVGPGYGSLKSVTLTSLTATKSSGDNSRPHSPSCQFHPTPGLFDLAAPPASQAPPAPSTFQPHRSQQPFDLFNLTSCACPTSLTTLARPTRHPYLQSPSPPVQPVARPHPKRTPAPCAPRNRLSRCTARNKSPPHAPSPTQR